MRPSALLVDFDGTLVHIDAEWHEARAEAERRGLPASVRAALAADQTGEYWQWLDRFELGAAVVSIAGPLEGMLVDEPWALVTDNGAPLVERAISSGLVPLPTASVCRRFGRPLKPSPAALLEALTALGAAADHALMIGDSTLDEQAAAAAGVAFRHVAELVS